MEEKNSKSVLLSVLGVAILIVAVIGISYAAFSVTSTSDANTISTGTISMSYSEPTNGINLTNALPMSDTNGKELSGTNNVFDFTVTSKASAKLDIPYEITITPVAVTTSATVGALSANQVKVYLTKNGSQVVAPTLISALSNSTVTGRTTSKTLYKTTDAHTGTGAAITTNYVLKMWISSDVNVSSIPDKTYEYRLKVNVDSTVAPLS